ncbi:hypothetical protein [Roseovarius indicus]|uniref:EF-hand domain-containing protein n=1 Tax=Roseovarius indicus TaxID=540747 RepID=A0A0T5NTG0_9RHOB|nr:hypothetical protein [Roseovarius indicus]KRS12232.1 hypothetical protein XM52_28280 [Roseovarius indicus]QEW29833.1 hypothetical protein RIdsm_05679 [Roseovarius indicus]SFE86777.1 hypothetical protein SAMN04488031_13210 [Roseovarius indicus]
MEHNLTLILTAAAALAAGSAVLAESGYGTGHHKLPERSEFSHSGDTMKAHFRHIDRNQDGVASREEVEVHDGRDKWFKRNALLGEFANPGF